MAEGSESVEDLMKRLTNQLEMDEGKFEMTTKEEGETLEVRTLNSGSGDPDTLLPFLSKFAGKLDQSQDNKKAERKEISEDILDIEASTKVEHVKRSEVESTDSLTDLVLQFRKDIKNSEWLKENTAEKWTSEHPELAKEYMEAAKK